MVQSKYGATGIIGLLLLTVGIKAKSPAFSSAGAVLIALMLADSLDQAENRPSADGGPSRAYLARLAERLESLADALEKPVPDA